MIFLTVIAIVGCKKTTPPLFNSSSSNSTPAFVTGLCATWQLDSMRQFRINVNGHPLTDTLLSVGQFYTVSTATLSLQSAVTSYTFGTEVIPGYAYSAGIGAISPYYTYGTTQVWNLSGDTLFMPTTNHPATCTMYWTVLSNTSHSLVITDKIFLSHCAFGAQLNYEWNFKIWYYHK